MTEYLSVLSKTIWALNNDFIKRAFYGPPFPLAVDWKNESIESNLFALIILAWNRSLFDVRLVELGREHRSADRSQKTKLALLSSLDELDLGQHHHVRHLCPRHDLRRRSHHDSGTKIVSFDTIINSFFKKMGHFWASFSFILYFSNIFIK